MYVELRQVDKAFKGYKALDDVSFSIEKGKLVGLLGPSGSGKTTILRTLAGLVHPDSGDIYIDGQRVNDVPASKRGIGFVFQNYALFRYMTVFDNIAFGLTVEKKDKAFIRERVNQLVDLVGLQGLQSRYPHQLSGGQKQRVAFARALAPNPHLLLLDEPFAAIDAKIRKELRLWLRETISSLGITSIFVTHDQDEAVEVADEIIIVNRGRIEQKGNPADIYKEPSTPFAAQFIGESSVLAHYRTLKGFESYEGYDNAVIRPELIQIAKLGKQPYAHASEEGTVEDVFFRGSLIEVHVNVQGMRLIGYRSPEEAALAPGEPVSVLIYRLYLYNEDKVRLAENARLKDENTVFI
ncbi:ABC transporter ATP-binding protein [Saccharibacillus sp. CPCC 101409]|uniref:sulfate/molybdate ABC transporter ATP-binding protein n=1 Tax=Saccharibacillus sp. CPCC 101409 TaxID=3058041 RepID=UPI0026726701|nr:ABC transporter ATP-binding protein [Saccharibacillus sp. CPCC 101409]MDO3412689.1 ABC transporter ATP-binding protein [Saccharibacillus sp. CPCC 101409]